MKKMIIAVGVAIVLAGVSAVAFADVVFPTITSVNFEKDGVNYDGDVDYEVQCLGYEDWAWDAEWEGDDEIGVVFSYSATCPGGECEIYEDYYMNYIDISYCNLIAEADGEEFFVENFADRPYGECQELADTWDMYDGENYYRQTDEYEQCLDETDFDFDGCEQYMELVDESEILMDDSGHPIERSCEITFDLLASGNPVPEEEELPFSDIFHGATYYEAIQYVKDEGIVDGYEDGTFQPDNQINRAEFTKIVIGAVFDSVEIEECSMASAFDDTPAGIWYEPYICMAAVNGIIDGYPDGTFKPGNDVNFVEAAKILVEAFNFGVDASGSGEWYAPYVDILEANAAIPWSIEGYDHKLTRAEMAEMIYRLREEIVTAGTQLPSMDW